MMGRLLKFLVFLILFGLIGLIGYAYLGDLSPDTQEMETPVILDAG